MNAILKSGTPHYGYVIVLCCCLIMAVNVGLVMSCAGISVGKFGLYMSFNYLTSTLMLSVAGRLMERFSVRLLLTFASAVLGVCLMAMPVFYALLLFALLIISVSTLNLFIPNYVVGMSYSLEQASFAASAVMVGVTIGKVALGMINDRSSMLGVLATIILGAGGLLLLLVGELSIWVVVCGGFFFGWAYAGVTVQTPMLVRTVFGSRDYPQIYSNISIALAAGGAITAGGWGLLSDYVDFKTILSLGALFLVLCGCIGIYALRTSKRLQ